MSWFNGRKKQLPRATGPYLPGCTDIMLDYTKNGILARIYYPTNIGIEHHQSSIKHWIPWFPDDSYLIGAANVLMCWTFVLRLLQWWMIADNGRIPVIYGSKAKTDEKLKCIIFSHGLGTARFIYSSICCELASRGFLVLVLEHRDHSSCTSFYYKSKTHAQNKQRTYIDFERIKLDKEHYKKRNNQINYRVNECSRALDFLIALNSGLVPYNVLNDEPISDNYYQIDFQLSDLVGNLDLDSVTAMGHSFGGATALKSMTKRPEFKQGIILDPWMFPIKNDDFILDAINKRPLLFINTQTFHIATNVNAMAKYLNDDNRVMYTVLHTTHESQTDTAALIGHWLNWFMKKLPAWTALKINNSIILRFLDDYVGSPSNIDDCHCFLMEQKQNVECGLTKPWA